MRIKLAETAQYKDYYAAKDALQNYLIGHADEILAENAEITENGVSIASDKVGMPIEDLDQLTTLEKAIEEKRRAFETFVKSLYTKWLSDLEKSKNLPGSPTYKAMREAEKALNDFRMNYKFPEDAEMNKKVDEYYASLTPEQKKLLNKDEVPTDIMEYVEKQSAEVNKFNKEGAKLASTVRMKVSQLNIIFDSHVVSWESIEK